MKDKIKLLSLDHDLKPINEKELAVIMMEACAVYNECQHSIPTSTKDAWTRVEYVAEEIIRRRDMDAVRKFATMVR